ncbi:hypothetical protein KC19_10G115000 [Ceratodon purpureus]|uniref:Uncharacterized protein n=1 Tax=Ceratodon purpureus TaxID=3225 RepID=A0A8T0GM18_CERPU|nr:hypothetical protein KC19_10G115000 [Ceratodon purpureus]
MIHGGEWSQPMAGPSGTLSPFAGRALPDSPMLLTLPGLLITTSSSSTSSSSSRLIITTNITTGTSLNSSGHGSSERWGAEYRS